MGNAAGSAEQPAGPAAPSPKQPAAPKQPMPAARELEERFSRVLVSVMCRALGAGGGRLGLGPRPRPWGLRYHLEIPGPVAAPTGGGSDSGFFQSDLALSPPKLSSAVAQSPSPRHPLPQRFWV